MKRFASAHFAIRIFLGSALLFLLLLPTMTLADEIVLHVENEDIQAVIKKVGTLTGTTFLFDPEQVKGKITILPAKNVSPQEALTLLQSALALHGYAFLKKEEGIWIIPTEEVVHSERIIEVVRLKYAKADEVASALAWIATAHGMQIVGSVSV